MAMVNTHDFVSLPSDLGSWNRPKKTWNECIVLVHKSTVFEYKIAVIYKHRTQESISILPLASFIVQCSWILRSQYKSYLFQC